ncbi:unnamed protein product [Rotaria sp. Silwood2]|nr:unnamed protein product [Rotaria sp. Silwood2]CAF4285728.1 unnamed protein product [Rotaria sp. Silwood2]
MNLPRILPGILGTRSANSELSNARCVYNRADEVELSRLLQLVLSCAVNSERKRYYIEYIRSLEESVQHTLMNAIQELMDKEQLPIKKKDPELEYQLKHLSEELNRTIKVKDTIENHCHELNQQIVVLQNDKLDLMQEISCLNERIQQYENVTNVESASYICYSNLQQQRIQSQQEEIFELEITLQDCRAQLDILRDENKELLKKVDP